ncbi:MAG: glycosyl hydrolase 53 family protein [Lentisphaeraceae bacterium]|nr:glycosyl hydrolase 53 family protein [Lentisphaeraceae bacterium]
MLGGDVSMFMEYEKARFQFRGKKRRGNAVSAMQSYSCNFFRLRIFVNPPKKEGMMQDLDYILKAAKKLKKAGANYLLDFHYSDHWADPGQQAIPKDWAKLTFPELVKQVEFYTSAVMTKLRDAQCLPTMVQIGNEVIHGFMWPHGKIYSEQGGWQKFTDLLKAGIRGVTHPLRESDTPRIMIHIAPSINPNIARNFYQKLKDYNIEYDIVGLSYYPWWHGGIKHLKDNIQASAVAQDKDCIVVETAYYTAPKTKAEEIEGNYDNMNWPLTPEGQKQFLNDVIKAVRDSTKGIGILWWYPEAVRHNKVHGWNNGKSALFDAKGNAHPALKSLK